MLTSIRLIVAPYHAGIPDLRVGGGPRHLLAHGLVSKLERFAPVNFSNIAPVDEFEGDIGKTFEVMRRISRAVSVASSENAFPIILSGNCNATAAAVAGLNDANPANDLSVLWFDAHDDLDTPEIHTSGYLDGMAASMMCGTSWQALSQTMPGHQPLPLERVSFIGVRHISDSKKDYMKKSNLRTIWGNASSRVDYRGEVEKLLAESHDSRVPCHIHLDADVLDDSLGRANEWPSPGGIMADELYAIMETIPFRVMPTSLTVCSYDPRLEGGDTVARLLVQAIEVVVRGVNFTWSRAEDEQLMHITTAADTSTVG
ncbi:uncharacterized protein CCOS01_09602 [Colletotrichum costaricense]|uniref:Arginase n=1 Tax=Colletotrichum costaricense TaxID=1209916 RepID=A0AAI9YUN0_9PEZI|nr:uncharacterized protein CCOS01_09602 [Colletotrichum costaricense]KAK1524515.1 hypothetical protein CCOS01_09602 [Colletotrichum costaricense]